MEQQMYNVDGDISKTILMSKNKSEDGHIWILRLGLFKVTWLFNFHTSSENYEQSGYDQLNVSYPMKSG